MLRLGVAVAMATVRDDDGDDRGSRRCSRRWLLGLRPRKRESGGGWRPALLKKTKGAAAVHSGGSDFAPMSPIFVDFQFRSGIFRPDPRVWQNWNKVMMLVEFWPSCRNSGEGGGGPWL